jgi:2-hydroxy-6-oxonona-2,4-dienedioate hydrolase
MTTPQFTSGVVNNNGAQIYYETAGAGTPFVIIHAGVADHRQWNNEFEFFSQNYKVVRFDMRGYGKSEPAEGDFRHIDDLIALLDSLGLNDRVVMMGCSMGGGLAMDFALAHPSRVKALIMVGSGPSGLELDVPAPSKFAEAEKAWAAGDLDLVAEIETQIWFDGRDRTPDQVDPAMRKLAYEMNRNVLDLEARKLGKRIPDTETLAFNRLGDLTIPVLVIVGTHDTPYVLAAAGYMMERIGSAQRANIQDAAHMPNMDQPEEFRNIVKSFLDSHSV